MASGYLVQDGADVVRDLGAALPGHVRPVPPGLGPQLGAVAGLGQTPLETGTPFALNKVLDQFRTGDGILRSKYRTFSLAQLSILLVSKRMF